MPALPQDQEPEASQESRPPSVPICRSEELLRGGRLTIVHGAETYHLRLTQSGKLLLTK